MIDNVRIWVLDEVNTPAHDVITDAVDLAAHLELRSAQTTVDFGRHRRPRGVTGSSLFVVVALEDHDAIGTEEVNRIAAAAHAVVHITTSSGSTGRYFRMHKPTTVQALPDELLEGSQSTELHEWVYAVIASCGSLVRSPDRAAIERFLGWYADHLLYHHAISAYIADLDAQLETTKSNLTEAGVELRIEKARYEQLEKLYEGLKLELSKGEPDKRTAKQIIGAVALATGAFLAGIGSGVGTDYLTDLRTEHFPVASEEDVLGQCEVTINLLEQGN